MTGFIRRTITISLIAVFAVALVGCSREAATTGTTAGKGTTLYWWRSKEDANIEVLQEIVSNFEQENKGVRVKVVLKDPRTYEQDAVEALAAGANIEGAPDILSLKSEDLPRNLAKLTPAPERMFDVLISKGNESKQTGKTTRQYVEEILDPAAFKAITFNNPATGVADVYGMPMALDTLVLYRNKKILEEAAEAVKETAKMKKDVTSEEIRRRAALITEAPVTWDDLLNVIPYIKLESAGEITRSAIALGTASNVERSYDILQALMMQNGTQLTSRELDAATFNQAMTGLVAAGNPGERALSLYLDFADPGMPYYTWNEDMPNSVDAFINGRVAMIIHYGSLYRYLINEKPDLRRDIEIAPLPQYTDPASPTANLKTTARMWVETVPARGTGKEALERQKIAWSFVYYLGSRKATGVYSKAMLIPSASRGAQASRFEALSDQKKYADVWYKGNQPVEADKIFISVISDVRTGRKGYQEALGSAASEVTAILQGSRAKWATATARKIAPTEDEEEGDQYDY